MRPVKLKSSMFFYGFRHGIYFILLFSSKVKHYRTSVIIFIIVVYEQSRYVIITILGWFIFFSLSRLLLFFLIITVDKTFAYASVSFVISRSPYTSHYILSFKFLAVKRYNPR